MRYILVHDLWQGLSALDTPNSLNHFVNLPSTKAWCYIILTSTNFVMTYLHISDTVVMWTRGIYFFSSTFTSCLFTVIRSTQLGWSWSSIRQHCNLFSHIGIFFCHFSLWVERRPDVKNGHVIVPQHQTPNNQSISCLWFSYLRISVFTCVHRYLPTL